MKALKLVAVLVTLSKAMFAQELQQPQLGIALDSISKITDRIDTIANKQKKEFIVLRKNVTGKVREKWQYATLKNGQPAFLKISYRIDSAYFEEDYYLSQGLLIFSEQKLLRYMPAHYGNKETSHWHEECYFINNSLIHEHSGGHGITETDGYDPEKVVLERFKHRISELLRHIKKDK